MRPLTLALCALWVAAAIATAANAPAPSGSTKAPPALVDVDLGREDASHTGQMKSPETAPRRSPVPSNTSGEYSDPVLRDLVAWVELNGGDVSNTRVTACGDDRGNCLVAARDMVVGDELFHIPAALRMTEHSAAESGPDGRRIADSVASVAVGDDAVHAPFLTLSLFLARERFYNLDNSAWNPHLVSLPAAPPSAITWDAEVVEATAGTSVSDHATKLRNLEQQLWELAHVVMHENAGPWAFPGTQTLQLQPTGRFSPSSCTSRPVRLHRARAL